MVRHRRKALSVLLVIMLLLTSVGNGGIVFAAEETNIVPVLALDNDSYQPGDSVRLDLKLTGTTAGDKTNSVTFDILFDSETFEFIDTQDGYIQFTSKDLVSGTPAKVSAMLTTMSDVALQEGATVLTVNFNVKSTASPGAKNFILAPVTMLDSNFNTYNINNGAQLTKTVSLELPPPAVNSVIIEGSDKISIPPSGSIQIPYSVIVSDQYGQAMTGETVTWSLNQQVAGVSVDSSTGEVTVASTAVAGTEFALKATSAASSAVYAVKSITLIDLPPAPQPDKPAGTYYGKESLTVTFVNVPTGYNLYYTVDGSDPSGTAGILSADKTVTITGSTTVKAVAEDPATQTKGLTAELSYSFAAFGTVTATPDAGTYSVDRTVYLSVTPVNQDTGVEYRWTPENGTAGNWQQYYPAQGIHVVDAGTITARIVSTLETNVISGEFSFNYNFDQTYKSVREALDALQMMATLTDLQLQFLVDKAGVMAALSLFPDEAALLQSKGVTEEELQAVIEVLRSHLVTNVGDFKAALNGENVNYSYLVSFVTSVKNAVPQEIKDAMARRGIGQEVLLLTALDLLKSGLDFFTVNDNLKSAVDNILQGRALDEDKAWLSSYGIKFENMQTFLNNLTESEKATLQSIMESMSLSYVAPPNASLQAGNYFAAQKVQLSPVSAAGDVVYYMLQQDQNAQGLLPQPGSQGWSQYNGGDINLPLGHAYRLVAYRQKGSVQSAVSYWNYTVGSIAVPELSQGSPAAGTYYGPVVVKLSAQDGVNEIRYTIDSSNPGLNVGLVYDSNTGIEVNSTTTIKAVAISGQSASQVATFNFTIQPVAVVTADFSTGVYGAESVDQVTGNLAVSMTTTTPDAKIYYTTDGTEPSITNGTELVNGAKIQILPGANNIKTVKARAYWKHTSATIGSYSSVSEYKYEVLAKPSITTEVQANGTVKAIINKTNDNAFIRYTTDGTTPSSLSSMYLGPIVLNSTKTIKAVVMKNLKSSPVATQTVSVNNGAITGKVTTISSAGEEIGLANIQVMVSGTNRYGVSDQQGLYTIDNVPPGDKTVYTYNTLGYAHKESIVTVTGGQTVQNVNFQLFRGAAIRGVIVDENGDGVQGINVKVAKSDLSAIPQNQWAGYWQETTTTAGGYFMLDNLKSAADYMLTASDYSIQPVYSESNEGPYTLTVGQLLVAGNITVNSLSSLANAGIKGTITIDGTPLNDPVIVEAFSPVTGYSKRVTVNQSNGAYPYEISGLMPGDDYEVAVMSNTEYFIVQTPYAQRSGITLTSNQQYNLDMVISAGFTFDGYIEDSIDSNVKIPNAYVQVVSGTTGAYGYAEADEQGYFKMEHLQPANDYSIYAWSTDINYLAVNGAESIDISQNKTQNIKMAKGGYITGTVQNTSGQPISGARLWVTEGPSWGRAITGAGGSFVIPGLQAGSYKISVEASDFANNKFYEWEEVVAGDVAVSQGTDVGIINLRLIGETVNAFYNLPDQGEKTNVFYTLDSFVTNNGKATFTLKYKNNSLIQAENAVAEFVLPTDGLKYKANTFYHNKVGANPTELGNVISFNIGDVAAGASGTIQFDLQVQPNAGIESAAVAAKIVSGPVGSRGEDVIGSAVIQVANTDINAPGMASPGMVKVYGKSSDNALVTVYGKKSDESDYRIMATTRAVGKFWNTNINLPFNGSYKMYATATASGVTSKKSDTKTVVVDAAMPQLDGVEITTPWFWEPVTSNKYSGVPAVVASQGHTITVRAYFSNTAQPLNVKASVPWMSVPVSMTGPEVGNHSNYEYTYNLEIPMTVSGEQRLTIYYSGLGSPDSYQFPAAELLILIDPSGYVFDAHSNQRLSGVKAVAEVQDPNTLIWTQWDAARYGQINPQYTDNNGKYGWDVPAGNYRVVFSKDGYQTVISETVVVPPPKTDLNVGLISLVSLSAPAVEAVTPADNANGVALNSNIVVTFSKAMDQSTIANLEVSDGSVNVPVNTALSQDGLTVTVDPIADFANSTTYTVTLKTAIKDTFGNGLPADFSWSFTTADPVTMVEVNSQLPVYARGTAVSIVGTLYINGTPASAGETVDIMLKDPNGQDILASAISATTDANGNFTATYANDTGNVDGMFTIEPTYNNVQYNTSQFEVITMHDPVATPGTSSFTTSVNVSLSTNTPGAEIRYTTDGSDPNGTSTLYAGAINVTSTTTIKAIAVKKGVSSDISTYTYTKSVSAAGGGGGPAPVTSESKVITKSSGGTLSYSGVTVDIPNNALKGDANISIKKLSSTEVNTVVSSGLMLKLSSDVYEIDTTGDRTFNKDITIRLPFDPVKIASGEVAEARYFNGTEWVKVEGAPEGNVMVVKVNHLTKFAVFSTPVKETKAFADIASHWAKNDIEFLADKGLVKGVGNNKYEPERQISRAEFATMLVNMLDISTANVTGSRFIDVQEGAWHVKAVNAAYNAGLVKGVSANSFEPDRNVTRQEMAVMVANALAYKGKSIEVAEQDVINKLAKYNDNAMAADWAKTPVVVAINYGIITGRSATELAPVANATRAESAVMMARLYNVIN